MHYFISGCDEAQIEKIKKVEKENGLLLIAYRGSEYTYECLTDDDLDKIKELEEELGVRFLALKKK
ncbi:hypothetical protein [uncultured Ilyobacter sp.]|uniref:hypothetical protein n=1 Tax=uncultured Ilyobacter sp. TaxID=544433 RepID=UPI0029C8BBB1|nr:hypothetical protein [uncultured Ilyobacter sp.]